MLNKEQISNSSVLSQKGESQKEGGTEEREEIIVFRKICCALFTCYLRFEIFPFALSTTNLHEVRCEVFDSQRRNWNPNNHL